MDHTFGWLCVVWSIQRGILREKLDQRQELGNFKEPGRIRLRRLLSIPFRFNRSRHFCMDISAHWRLY